MLYRPKQGRMIAGVCLALAQRFGISVFVVRLVFVLLLILPPAAVFPYILLWLVIPGEASSGGTAQ